ncbi:hypothetical protein AHAS_Ahas11G0141600 [Arachis hypogaea]
MANRGRKRGWGRGKNSYMRPKTTGNNPVNFMATLENMAAAIQVIAKVLGNQVDNGNGGNGGDRPMTLSTFIKINPLNFRETTNSTEADN